MNQQHINYNIKLLNYPCLYHKFFFYYLVIETCVEKIKEDVLGKAKDIPCHCLWAIASEENYWKDDKALP
jgi:hypothetical protein